MKNELRILKVLEFKRALSYTSDIMDLEKKIDELEKKCEQLENEKREWNMYSSLSCISEKDKNFISDEKRQLNNQIKRTQEKCKELKNKRESYINLVSHICKYVFFDEYNKKEYIYLKNDEIDAKKLDEFIYLINENFFNDKIIYDLNAIIKNINEFAKFLYHVYGPEKIDLIVKLIKLENKHDEGYQE